MISWSSIQSLYVIYNDNKQFVHQNEQAKTITNPLLELLTESLFVVLLAKFFLHFYVVCCCFVLSWCCPKYTTTSVAKPLWFVVHQPRFLHLTTSLTMQLIVGDHLCKPVASKNLAPKSRQDKASSKTIMYSTKIQHATS